MGLVSSKHRCKFDFERRARDFQKLCLLQKRLRAESF